MQLVLDTFYQIVVRLNNGLYTLDVDDVRKASGTYIGLTTFAPTLTIGNNQGLNTEAFIGQMDVVKVIERVWSDAEVNAECVLYVPGCPPPPPPVFDPFVMVSGMQGDGLLAANNTNVVVTMVGTPDPQACIDLTEHFLAYGQVRALSSVAR